MDTLWVSWQMVRRMVRDRGFRVTKKTASQTRESLRADVESESDDPGKINRSAANFVAASPQLGYCRVFFHNGSTMSKKESLELLKQLQEQNATGQVIIIFTNGQKKQTSKSLSLLFSAKNLSFTVFCDSEVAFDATKHELNPKFRLLTDEEQKKKFADNIVYQFPKIRVGDRMARHYGARIGQVFEITRISETAGKCTTYRTVVE